MFRCSFGSQFVYITWASLFLHTILDLYRDWLTNYKKSPCGYTQISVVVTVFRLFTVLLSLFWKISCLKNNLLAISFFFFWFSCIFFSSSLKYCCNLYKSISANWSQFEQSIFFQSFIKNMHITIRIFTITDHFSVGVFFLSFDDLELETSMWQWSKLSVLLKSRTSFVTPSA